MTQIFANRAELMPAGETTEEHRKWQEEEAGLVEKDRLAPGRNGGLFRGCFRRGFPGRFSPMDYMARPPIRDLQDGVDRCPRCTWELEDGSCQGCGYPSEGDELSDSDFPEYDPPDIYAEEDGDMERATLDDIRAEAEAEHRARYGFDSEYNSEFSPAPLSEQSYSSEGSVYASHAIVADNGPPFRPARVSGLHHDAPETLYDSSHEETEEGSEDDDAGSLDDFIVDDQETRQHSPSSSVRDPQWETDDGTEGDEMQSHDSENDFEIEAENMTNDGDVSFSTGPNDQWDTEEDSDEGPIAPSRRQLAHRVAALHASSSDDEQQPVAPNRRRRRRDSSQSRSNAMVPFQRNRAVHTHSDRPDDVPIEIESDSDVPMSASQAIRRGRAHHPSAPEEESDDEASSATATIGRLSPVSFEAPRIGNRPSSHDSNEISPIRAESSSGSSVNDTHHPPQTSASVRQQHCDLSRNYLGPPTFSPPHSRRHQANRRRSPLPSSSHRHSPASGPSYSITSEEQQTQGLRDRRARKAERKAERRRLKAERERRRSGEARGSASPSQ